MQAYKANFDIDVTFSFKQPRRFPLFQRAIFQPNGEGAIEHLGNKSL